MLEVCDRERTARGSTLWGRRRDSMSADVLQWSVARPGPLPPGPVAANSSRPNHWSPLTLLRLRLAHALQRPRDER